MRLAASLLAACLLAAWALGCCYAQLPFRTRAVMVPGSPSAEVSAIRLKTGDLLTMICRWNGGTPDWEFSNQVKNPSFVEVREMREFTIMGGKQCLNSHQCQEKTIQARFLPKLAGLYRCQAVPQEPFIIMWVNETVTINRPTVLKEDSNKPVKLTCNVNLLPDNIEYQREAKWYITNDRLDSVDVSQCCANDYVIESGSNPGPVSLLIPNYDVRRDTGSFRCRIKVKDYDGDLTNSTRIYAEAVTSFDVATGGSPTPVRQGKFVEALSGQQLNVTCISRGYPGPNTLRLVQVSNQQVGVVKVIASGLSATLSISNLTDNFNDSFLCESTQEGLPVGAPSVTTLVLKVVVVDHLSPPEEPASVLAMTSTMQIIIIGVTIPVVTIIIIVILVRCWCQRKNRGQAQGVTNTDSPAHRSRSPAKPPRSKDACEVPLNSSAREDDRL